MSIRSRIWTSGRTWAMVLTFVAFLPACPAVSRAEPAWYAALGSNIQKAFSAFVEKPTAANLQAVRGLLAADRAYTPYSDDLTQLKQLVHDGKNREAIALVVKSQPNLLLSPLAHRLAAEAARRLGDEKSAATEVLFADRCEEGILRHGRRQRVAAVPHCPPFR